MYQLVEGSGAIVPSRTLCTKDDPAIARSYGCTAITGRADYAYPFDTSTITIGIDGTGGPDNARYSYPYLWDVVVQEYGLHLGSEQNKPLAGVRAQAIAARTYVYQRIYDAQHYLPFDNSAQFHVFLPYAYEAFLDTNDQRQRLVEAVQERLYLSPPSNPYPITALYGTDNPEYTAAGRTEGAGEFAQGNGYNPRQPV